MTTINDTKVRKVKDHNLSVEVVDDKGGDWTFEAYVSGKLVYEREVGGHVVEDLKIETGRFHCCGVEPDIDCPSLAEAHTRFPQSSIRKIEEAARDQVERDETPYHIDDPYKD